MLNLFKRKLRIPDTVRELLEGKPQTIPANAQDIVVCYKTPDGRRHIIAERVIDPVAHLGLRAGYEFHLYGTEGRNGEDQLEEEEGP